MFCFLFVTTINGNKGNRSLQRVEYYTSHVNLRKFSINLQKVLSMGVYIYLGCPKGYIFSTDPDNSIG